MKSSQTAGPYRKLKVRSFKNKTLKDADFSDTDIRGVDFTRATLINANFTNCKAGQPTKWVISWGVIALLMTIVVGGIVGFVSLCIGVLSFSIDKVILILIGVASLITLAVLVGLVIYRGLDLVLIGSISVITLLSTLVLIPTNAEVGVQALLLAFLIAVFFLNTIVGSIILASVWRVAKTVSQPTLCIAMLSAASLMIVQFSAAAFEIVPGRLKLISYITVIGIAALNTFLCLYIAWRSTVQDSKYLLVHQAVVAINSWQGTCFRGANLTGADFTQAMLERTDLRQANLSNVRWFGAQRLARARTEQTYLASLKIRQLVVSLQGQNQVFDRLNLRHLNLSDASLQDASFIGSDLGDVDLRGANLQGAKLARAQLYQADLREACLTGSYIQDWGISANTRLDDVRCDYIYMHLPTRDNPDPLRKPDNAREFFEPGDFTDFITPIIKTLDLYHQQHIDPRQMASTFKSLDFFHRDGIDPTAAAIAFNQLAAENPQAELKVVALDGRGNDKVRLQAQVAKRVDKAELSTQYFEKYQQAQALPYGEQQSLIAAMGEKDKRIQSLEDMLKSAIASGESYIKMSAAGPTTRILLLSANPQGTNQRHLATEVREISNGLQRAKRRDQFEIVSKWAVRSQDLHRALLDLDPNIVHFSGYGSAQAGLALENEAGQAHFVSAAALAKLFSLFSDKVDCVVLNDCYSETQAEEIGKYIKHVVGTPHLAVADEITNQSAVKFAVGFYDALGAGRSIEEAFEFGRVAIEIEGLPMSSPQSFTKKIR